MTAIRVLLLEDVALDAELLDARLQAEGVIAELLRVVSRDAFTQALTTSWDIILSDYNVPGFDGAEALALTLATCPDTPFVFVTGALGEERAIELLKQGATDYVLKDHLDRLVPGIQRALRESKNRLERRRAELARDESQRALVTLMNNIPGMAFRCRPEPPWTFDYASGGTLELCGYQPEHFYTGGIVTWASLMHPDDIDRVARDAAEAFAQRRQLTVEYRIQTRAGEWKWVWDRSVAVYDPAGALVAIEGFAIDITDRKRQEEAMRERSEFEQHLIGIVSHDLRNPLNTIALATDTALLRDDVNARVTKALVRIKSATSRAERMIRDLLDFTLSRLGSGIPIERGPVSIRDAVAQAIEDVGAIHAERVIRLVALEDLVGWWDRERLLQVVTNLVTNAVRYSPAESEVDVRLEVDGDHAELHVHNVGEPIAPELLPRIFQPFQRGTHTVDRSSRNVGLGLYIVDQIVRGHDGTVEVRSSAAEGTTFRIRLPQHARSTRP